MTREARPRGRYDSDQRLRAVVGACLAVSLLLTWRLFQKSVVEHPLYAAQAESQYEVSKELPSRRGTVYAQDAELGKRVPVAATEERFDVSVVPRNVTDKPAAARVLAELFGLDEPATLAAMDNDRLYLPPFVRGINKDQKEAAVARGFTGLLIEKRHARVYPERSTAAHVLGFVNRDGQGNYGVEAYYDEELRGTAGSVVGQRDTLGRIISTVSQVAPENGVSIELTIDHNVQFAAEQRLAKALAETEAQSGQILILDPRTGEVIAMAAQPAFDPNTYNDVPAEEQFRFQNPLVAAVYEPGSILKPVTMATALELGKVEPDTKETFGKSVVVQGYEINTALDKAYGEETMTQVLENSDNVGMVWVAGKMSNEELHAAFVRFGFDEATGVDVAGETRGSLLELSAWREIHRATMAFGQGISTTPLQVARAWAALINGGTLVTPHVVRRLIGDRGVTVDAEAPQQEGIIRPETSEKIRGMLRSVVDNGPYGSTRVPGYAIGGKTGTAQIANPDGGGYLEDAFTHSLLGFFPADAPEYLMLVKLDRPKQGRFAESTAGPVFHDLAQYLFNYYKIAPDRE
ncbi:penicillin-binding protein 2 [Candidatus Berkelbacteria bacterium]|nr:penicillin-binding protein 2 [Candidatus Berkelbacteria bacterium]